MRRCRICGCKKEISQVLGVCVDCIRDRWKEVSSFILEAHRRSREDYGLPFPIPREDGGVSCGLCSNDCRLGDGDIGFCGLRKGVEKGISSLVGRDRALVHTYLDPHPTNCCATYFCPGGTGAGYPRYAYSQGAEYGYYNYAVFFYGCSFDCLFCQNYSHKGISRAPSMTRERFVEDVVSNRKISCICFFGGSPEPQFPYALKASREVLEEAGRIVRICWEWNGSGKEDLVRSAAELSLISGGNVKFDLKAFTPEVYQALCGVSNERVFSNFKMIYEKFYRERANLPLLNATTLLVPGYVDEHEVEGIAKFIADLDRDIPYSLLIFHPNYMMMDLPVTPYPQVEGCFQAAKKHLNRVHLGNIQLLGLPRDFHKWIL